MKSLKIIVIILAIIIGVGGSMWIFKSKRNNNVKVKSPIKDTKSFHFSYSVGNYTNASYSYDVELENGKYFAIYKADGVSEEDAFKKEISKDTVLELEKILNEYKIYKWDGFNKSDEDVLDGYSFSLNYWNQNKEDIHASGYMMYPNNYREFRSAIINFYNVLFEEEIKTLKSPIW